MKYSGFRTPDGGFYYFRCLPQGMVNSPASFQRSMDALFAKEKWDSVFIYMDDLITFSDSFAQHLCHLRTVFSRARSVGLKFKLSECKLAQQESAYLGHVITGDTIRPDESLTEKMTHYPIPETKKHVSAFLGLGNFFRRFVKDCAKIASPLHDLTKNDSHFRWTDSEQLAFETLRTKIASRRAVAQIDWSKPFTVECDASNFALGAVLPQADDHGRTHAVCYLSRRMTPQERKYCIREKEQLAVVWALRKLRPYLVHRPFTVITDHKALVYMQKHTLNDRTTRWLLSISELSFVVRHRCHAEHVVPDAFSRVIYKGFLKSDRDDAQEDTIYIYAIPTIITKPSLS